MAYKLNIITAKLSGNVAFELLFDFVDVQLLFEPIRSLLSDQLVDFLRVMLGDPLQH